MNKKKLSQRKFFAKNPKGFNQELDEAIHKAEKALLKDQHPNGHWCYELEADCTIPAEYILMMHFVNEIDNALQQQLARYLRDNQNEDGGWPLYFGGQPDVSCSVKCYYALKLAGDPEKAAHMQKAKACILNMGGAAKANVFTRIMLAQFEQVPWRATPFMPVEIMFAPKWFYFHLSKVSYWSRTVMVPLLVLCSLKATAVNPKNIHIPELFTVPADKEKHYFNVRSKLNRLFLSLNQFARRLEWMIPNRVRKKAIHKAMTWVKERSNDQHGLGAIFPAMVNAFEAFKVLDQAEDQPYLNEARTALQNLLAVRGSTTYCQPCVSPVWDTGLALLALLEVNHLQPNASIEQGFDWLKAQQCLNHAGDWQQARPKLAGGGWPFQYQNAYYPDLDDTALIGYALALADKHKHYQQSISRAQDWVAGMQSDNGGFGSFDVNNTCYYLNEIPFADHGALLDPPSADVSARCAMFLAQVNDPKDQNTVIQCVNYLLAEQETNGSWFGRWGTNYIYGTWSVLEAFKVIGFHATHPTVRRATHWLKTIQNEDGGWGEDNGSYYSPPQGQDPAASTSFQTAWALLALMAGGEHHSDAVKKGIQYLIDHQKEDGFWYEPYYTAPGFPRVFYLKYHGYSKYFPTWALGRYRRMTGEKP